MSMVELRSAAWVWASVLLLASCVLGWAASAQAGPAHGFSPVHALKYPAGFAHFGYVRPDAPKGGRLRLGATGTFDSLNPLLYPGRVPGHVRDLVFDTLLERSADEPAGYYGRLAETVEVSGDGRTVRFTLREAARWHDGEPVTAEDVTFTFEILREQGAPFYRQALRHYTVEEYGPRQIVFRARAGAIRDMVRILGSLPVQPAHFWESRDLKDHGLTPPLGSGPYRVEKVNAGAAVTLARAPDYWGAALPVNRGRFNFDRIETVYYRDDSVALEAFRAGDFDLRLEGSAAQWAGGYDGPALREGRIRRDVIETATGGELTTLVFNLRRAPFDDVRVRKAISLAYDFGWTNANLMHGLMQPVESLFGDTPFAARGAATSGERALLDPFAAALPAGLFDAPSPGLRSGIESRRDALAKADRLLRDAGFPVRDGARVSAQTGEPLTVDLLNHDPSVTRILGPFARNLERMGITLRYGLVDPATSTRRTLDHDFDMVVLRWSPRAVPGNAESLLWSSALADRKGSYALAGAKDAALDATLEAMVSARKMDKLVTAARAFDRVMRWRHYALGLWRKDEIWLAYWNRFGRPDETPGYAPSFIDRWWAKPEQRESRASLGE